MYNEPHFSSLYENYMGHLLVSRFETKYLISQQEYVQLASLLKSILKLDAHSGSNHSYAVRSLYFDSPDDTDYHSKTDGFNDRKKIRLRLYNSTQEHIKLELKCKSGDAQKKDSLWISKLHASELCGGNIECLLEYPLMGDIYQSLKSTYARPVVLIDYDREAYVDQAFNIRINFDKNMRASRNNLDLYDFSRPTIPLLQANNIILEVKYSLYLPDYIKNILSSCELTRTSFSKYCIARETTTNHS